MDNTEDNSISAADIADYKKMHEEVLTRVKVIKEQWLDKTKDTYEIYEGVKADQTPFNILYSNTEILVPNLFSSAPKPIVRRRFGEMRANEAARAAERMAEYCMDTNMAGYPDFVDAVESVVMDAALPGQGQSRVRLVNNTAVIDYVPHTHFVWGYARRWEDTPWVSYRHEKTIKDVIAEFELDSDVSSRFIIPTEETSSGTKDKGPATIWVDEVWDKRSRMVLFFTEAHPDVCIKKLPDPLELTGFFPSDKPLRLLSTPCSTMPRAMYGLYKKQAQELNLVTERIKRLTQAIQVRGVYDAQIPEMKDIFADNETENSLFPAGDTSALMRDGGIDKHIWIVPVEKYIVVLQQLYVIRDQIKSTIYEILGIGDILRGVSAASETASAQEIKDKWGTLRIKRSRERVSRFVRTQIRFLIEVSSKHIQEDVWAQVTGLPYITALEAQVLAQSSMQPQIGPDGAPMPPPEPKPDWGTVLNDLRNDLTRSYRIDIETNSTVDGDATSEKEEVAEFMNAFGQAMTGLGPMATFSPDGFEVAKKILTEICKRFRMGTELVQALEQAKPPAPPSSPEADKMLEDAKAKMEDATAAEDQAKAQFESQSAQIKQLASQLEQQQRTLDAAAAQLKQDMADLDMKEKELKLQASENAIKDTAAKVALQQASMNAKEQVQGMIDGMKAEHQAAEEKFSTEKQAVEKKVADSEAAAATETKDEASDSQMKTLITAMAAQAEGFTKLIETFSKPITITKTAPGVFQRSI